MVNAGFGDVVIWAWPGVWQIVVFGPVSVHYGAAAAGMASTNAAMSGAGRARNFVVIRMVGLLVAAAEPRTSRQSAYPAAYNPLPVTRGRSSVVQMPGDAATTAGIALTMRMAVANTPAWLWSPLGLDRQTSMA